MEENTDPKIIAEIAQELDCGNDCYFNPKTKELVAIPNFSLMSDDAVFEEFCREDFDHVMKQKEEFIKIEILESSESFQIMVDFLDEIPDEKLKSQLLNNLQHRKPFRNFMNSLDHSDYREDWFAFKQKTVEKIIQEKLNTGKLGNF